MIPFLLSALLGSIAAGFALLAESEWSVVFAGIFCLGLALYLEYFKRLSLLNALVLGFSYHLLAFKWVFPALEHFTSASTLVSLTIAISLWVASSLRFLLFAILYSFLKQKFAQSQVLVSTLSLPIAWLASELFMLELIPWRLGNPFVYWPLLFQVSDLFGVEFVSFLVLWWAALLVSLRKSMIQATLTIVFSLGLALGYGFWRESNTIEIIENSSKISTLTVQSNLQPKRDFNAERRVWAINQHRQLTKEFLKSKTPQLIIWPESAIWEDYSLELKSIEKGSKFDPLPWINLPIIFGTQVKLSENKDELDYYNAALSLASSGQIRGRYFKEELFPFGEYVPFQNLFPALRKLNPRKFNILPGPKGQTGFFVKPHEAEEFLAAVAICYEDIWAGVFLSQFQDKNSPALLINISNDAWFPDSITSAQHHLLAAARAVEFKRFLVRATVDGKTAIVDPLGRTRYSLPAKEGGVLFAEGIALINQTTIYSKLGLLPAYFLTFSVLLYAGIRRH